MQAFPAFVAEVLQQTGLPPAMLELEITESMVMTDEVRAGQVLAAGGNLESLTNYFAG